MICYTTKISNSENQDQLWGGKLRDMVKGESLIFLSKNVILLSFLKNLNEKITLL